MSATTICLWRPRNGRAIAVEFISTLFLDNHHKVIQCNIRDITTEKLTTTSSHKVYSGNEHRKMERRKTSRMTTDQLKMEIEKHRQTEKSLRKALEEIKALKDRLVVENIFFRQEISKKKHFDHIIGKSDGLKYVLYRAEQVAPIDTTVLILGETGTGKELIAAAIHNLSPRRNRPALNRQLRRSAR